MYESTAFRVDGLSPGVFNLVGELDMNSSRDLLAAFASMDGQAFDIDLSALTFVDSSGFRAMMQLRRAHHRAHFVHASTNVARLAGLLGLAGPLGIDDDAERPPPK